MNYAQDRQSLSGVFTTLVGAAKSGYDWYDAEEQARKNRSAQGLLDAQAQQDARIAEQQAGYAQNWAKVQFSIDSEKTKRYLIIGGAIGVPLILLLATKKKGRRK